MNIDIELIQDSKLNTVDFNNLAFGRIFTDHMLVCDFANGEWKTPKIMPYGPMLFEPSARVFHYGQAVFEGMKAYKDDNDDVFLFRPDENFNRINKSGERLAMPTVPEDVFFEGLKKLLEVDNAWIKKGEGNSLYIRPFIIASEGAISASPAEEYKFIIICSPAQSYYAGEVRVIFAEKYSRSADGGVGFAKAAGNYAAQFYPTSLAHKEGYQQIVWTDASTHEFLEEAGTMNVFFRIGDKLVTAPTSDRILDGVTRKSIVQLAKDFNIDIEVRRVSVTEIKEAAKKGELKEMFGSGTAAVINPIKGFKHQNDTFELPEISDSYASFFKEKLLGIQYNKLEDKHNWRVKL
ncbi:branched-chain amino acid aminotransferase [Tenacibaculum crassostreae]|uniref:branched-chain amino acid aminotransferase n=1 Tax=Tenacibaculum crassostreae TaxID=502683 RepID=UPI0038953DEE